MAWLVWASAAVLLIILEMLTAGFVLAPLGLAAAVAAVAAVLGAGAAVQLAAFAAAAAVTFLGLRPVVLRLLHRDREPVATNVAALVGQTGLLVTAIDPSTGIGRVKAGGDDWRAVSEQGLALEAGTRVLVTEVRGSTLSVVPYPLD
jgi:membrane protein implicated in regulation of membrane protease activity